MAIVIIKLKTYQFKLRPNRIQNDSLWKQLKLTRELYNLCLEELISHYKLTGKHLNLFAQDKLHGTKEHPDIPAVLVDTVLKRLHRSFENFFRRCKEGASKKGFPRFKSPTRWNSIQFRDAKSNGIRDTYFCAPRSMGGRMRFNRHQNIKGIIRFCRILRKPNGWFLQVICDCPPEPLPKTGQHIGLDFGVKYLISDSAGNKIENPTFLKRSLRKLRIAQRRVSRRVKGSRRRKKAARLVARLHQKISDQRSDYLHKAARHYINRFDNIYLEDLTPLNMVRTHCLARSIVDASWGTLRELIEAKAECAGRKVIAVPPHFTSKVCSECGELVQKALSVRTHVCPNCGYSDCRDTNAAKNILRLGCSLQEEACNSSFGDLRSTGFCEHHNPTRA